MARVAAAALVVLTAASLVVGCGGAEGRRARAITRGDEYLAAGKIDKARVEYRNALQISPNNAVSRYKNGVVQERAGNLREAFQLYQGALEVDPDYVAARADVARLELFSGAPERAIETVKAGLEKHPDDASLLTVRAVARSQLKDTAGAIEDAERAVKLDPRNENAIAALAGLYGSSGRPQEARALLEKSIAALPESIDLKLALAQFYTTVDERPKSEALLRAIVQQRPDDPAHRIRLAQFLSRSGQDDAAEKVLRDAAAALPKDRAIKATLLAFLGARRGAAAEEEEFRRQIAADPADAELRFAMAEFYALINEPGKAEAVLREVISREGTRPAGLSARAHLATLKVTQNDVAEASKLVGEVLAVNPRDADALNIRGNLLLAKGDAKGAIDDLRAVLRDQPNAVPVMRTLARAHVRNGEPALAEETLRRALEVAPADPAVRRDLGLLLVSVGKLDAGKVALEQLVKDQPGDLAAQEGLFKASIASKDAATARHALDALAVGHEDTSKVHVYEGELAELENRPEDALRVYEKALAAQPDAVEPLQAVTRILVRSKRLPEALTRLDAAALAAPKSAVPLNLKGDLLLTEKRYAEAEGALSAAAARAPKWWLPYLGLASVKVGLGDTAAAIKLLTDATGKVDEPRALRAELASLYQSAGRNDEAIRQYEQMLSANPADAVAANNLAMLLVSGQPDVARVERAAALVKDFSVAEDPLLLDTYGWVKVKQGDVATALPALEKAAAGAARNPVIRYHLGIAQLASGQADAGRESLRQALAGGTRFEGMDEARAALAGRSTGG